MKCCFRKITKYEKYIEFSEKRQEGGYRHKNTIVPCIESEADTKIEEYADCYAENCTAYSNGICLRLKDEKK